MDSDIELWKHKKTLNKLKNCSGNGTSMISLVIPPKEQISRFTKMLTDEYGTASNIKSRVNRLSVLSAIQSAQHKLRTVSKVPKNGLGVYVGTVVIDGKERKVSIAIEPLKPINTSLYMCDSCFHVDSLLNVLNDELKYGFVIIDGHGTLFATVHNDHKEILQNLSVELPKKHGRGGQSSVRFARLRVEKRLAYVKKVSEICTNLYITDNKCNVEGIVFGGHSDLKNDLQQHLDQRIAVRVIGTVDTNYGGLSGLSEALSLSVDKLQNVKFGKEKKILLDFFTEVASDAGKFCHGIRDTMQALEMGAVETLIVYEELKVDQSYFIGNVEIDEDGLLDLDTVTFLDWIAESYGKYGCVLHFVTNKSDEGTQFVEGFGGIGAVLKYKIDIPDNDELSDTISDDIF